MTVVMWMMVVVMITDGSDDDYHSGLMDCWFGHFGVEQDMPWR